MEKGYIKNQLQDLLNRIPDFFEPDELAYYTHIAKMSNRLETRLHGNYTK